MCVFISQTYLKGFLGSLWVNYSCTSSVIDTSECLPWACRKRSLPGQGVASISALRTKEKWGWRNVRYKNAMNCENNTNVIFEWIYHNRPNGFEIHNVGYTSEAPRTQPAASDCGGHQRSNWAHFNDIVPASKQKVQTSVKTVLRIRKGTAVKNKSQSGVPCCFSSSGVTS